MEYNDPSTPPLNDLMQLEDDEGPIVVPVRVVQITDPTRVQPMPARDSGMRSIVVTANSATQSLLGRDLRRSRVTVWATAATANGTLLLGSDKNEVESGTAALLPAMINTLVNGAPPMLTVMHCQQLWVRNAGANDITVSYVSEYWAD